MSYGTDYQRYGGNPYGSAEAGQGGYGTSNPYGGTPSNGGYGTANPYGGTHNAPLQPPPATLQHEESNYSQASQYSQPPAISTVPGQTHTGVPYTQQEFLSRIEGIKSMIGRLTSQISRIANIHQRILSSPDNAASSELEAIVSNTQIENGQIRDQIKGLEKDALRTPESGFKKTQVENLKRQFKQQLQDYEQEEKNYRGRYREAIARQYKIVNPEATQAEIDEAANANWGDEGVFQTALKSNRSGQANSVLGAVRARHNDIQRIEATLSDLALLFNQLNEQVVLDEPKVIDTEQGTHNALDDTERANVKLNEGIKSARRARRLKWWTLLTFVAIIAIVALVLGLYFGLKKK